MRVPCGLQGPSVWSMDSAVWYLDYFAGVTGEFQNRDAEARAIGLACNVQSGLL